MDGNITGYFDSIFSQISVINVLCFLSEDIWSKHPQVWRCNCTEFAPSHFDVQGERTEKGRTKGVKVNLLNFLRHSSSVLLPSSAVVTHVWREENKSVLFYQKLWNEQIRSFTHNLILSQIFPKHTSGHNVQECALACCHCIKPATEQ